MHNSIFTLMADVRSAVLARKIRALMPVSFKAEPIPCGEATVIEPEVIEPEALPEAEPEAREKFSLKRERKLREKARHLDRAAARAAKRG